MGKLTIAPTCYVLSIFSPGDVYCMMKSSNVILGVIKSSSILLVSSSRCIEVLDRKVLDRKVLKTLVGSLVALHLYINFDIFG